MTVVAANGGTLVACSFVAVDAVAVASTTTAITSLVGLSVGFLALGTLCVATGGAALIVGAAGYTASMTATTA